MKFKNYWFIFVLYFLVKLEKEMIIGPEVVQFNFQVLEMDKIIFIDKNIIPGNSELIDALGETAGSWHILREYVHLKYPAAMDEWNYPGEKYGWSFRIKDKKRVILYLLPREKYFKAAFVFGQKATDLILKSRVSGEIKAELESAKVYAEGRGIRIEIRDELLLDDIKELIDIKLSH
jgi:hypothetical protein